MTAPPTPDRPPTAVAVETFAAPAIEVWRYRLDFTNLPEYNPDVSVVERIAEGDPGGTGGVLGPGARYTFRLADASKPGVTHPVELWPVTVVEPTLVAAAMTGASDAYEEFTVRPTGDAGCRRRRGTVVGAVGRWLRGHAHALGVPPARCSRPRGRGSRGERPGADQQGAPPHASRARGRGPAALDVLTPSGSQSVGWEPAVVSRSARLASILMPMPGVVVRSERNSRASNTRRSMSVSATTSAVRIPPCRSASSPK